MSIKDDALRAARACILIDRTALADAHFDHGLGRVDDDGQDGMDEYDAVLAQIDAALGEPAAQPKTLADLQRLVTEQAYDEGLWFEARTAPEAHLQAALRQLHAAIERALEGK